MAVPSSLKRSAPVAVLLTGCALLAAGIAGVARVDDPLRAAAAEPRPALREDVDVTWHHRRHHDGDCPPGRPDRPAGPLSRT